MKATLEHLNITAAHPDEFARVLCELFEWKVRWQGESIYGGYTVHVGDESSYLALYRPPELKGEPVQPYFADRAVNHIGVLVEDLAEVRQRALAAGLEIHNENEIEPGKRIYFYVHELEFEVVEY